MGEPGTILSVNLTDGDASFSNNQSTSSSTFTPSQSTTASTSKMVLLTTETTLKPNVPPESKLTGWVVIPVLASILCALLVLGFMAWRRKRAYGTYNIFRSPRGEARHHLIPVYNNSGNGMLSRPDIRRTGDGYDPFDPTTSNFSRSTRSLNDNPMSVTNQNHLVAASDLNWEDRLLDEDAVYRPSVYQPNLGVGSSPSTRPRLEFTSSHQTGKL